MANQTGPINDLAAFKQAHPGLYADCVSEGVERERARILATLPPLSANSRERFALECIRDGSPMTETIKANYLILLIEAARRDQASAEVFSVIHQRLGVDNGH